MMKTIQKTIRNTIAGAAIAAGALTSPLNAQSQYTANVHTERLESGANVFRAELYKGPLGVLRADLREGVAGASDSKRFGFKLPVGAGFIQGFSEHAKDVSGFAVSSELGSSRFRIGNALETREANGERTNLVRGYALASNGKLTAAAGLGSIGSKQFASAVGYARTPSMGGSLGMLVQEGEDVRLHGSVGKYTGDWGFLLVGRTQGERTSLDLVLSDGPRYPWEATVGPNFAYDAFHDVPLVSDIMTIPIQPGIPSHIRTKNNGVLRVSYNRNGETETLPVDLRVFPARILGSGNSFLRGIMTGAGRDLITGVNKFEAEVIFPIAQGHNFTVYAEKASGSPAYLFAGHYVTLGGKK